MNAISVFFHGCPDTPKDWIPFAEELKQKLNLEYLIPDLIEIENQSKNPSVHFVVLKILTQLEKIDPDRSKKIIIFCHDIGGIFGWELARTIGDRLLAFVSMNGPDISLMRSRILSPSQVIKSWYIFFFQVPLVSDFLIKLNDKNWVLKAFRNGGRSIKRELHAVDKNSVFSFLPYYRSAFKDALLNFNTKPQKIKAPTLILWGKDDPFLDPPTHNEVANLSSNFEIRVLDGKHWIAQENKDKLIPIIEKFIKGLM